MKKILIISEIYKRGGSGHATSNIYNFLKKEFKEVFLLIPFGKYNDKNILIYFNLFSYFYYLLIKLLDRFLCYFLTTNKFYFFHNIFRYSAYSSNKINNLVKKHDINCIIILWFEYILNYEVISEIKNNNKNIKIIFWPFDMYNFTGGCRYSQSCNNYEKECIKCPALYNPLSNIAHNNFLKKKYFFKNNKVEIIVNSDFAKNLIDKTSLIKKDKLNIIHYPVNIKINFDNVNSEIFSLKKKNKNKKIIFFGAQNLNEWRKGFFHLKNILLIFKARNPKLFSNMFFIYGGHNQSKIKIFDNNNYFSRDFFNLDELYYVYKISDLIIIPSIQEWGSLMMSESFYLKKNIFCFDTGSSKDFIINNFNGYIFQVNDLNKFVDSLKEFMLNSDKFLFKQKNKDELKYINKLNNPKIILDKFKNLIYEK